MRHSSMGYDPCRLTHVVVLVVVLNAEGNLTHSAQLTELPLLVGWIMAGVHNVSLSHLV